VGPKGSATGAADAAPRVALVTGAARGLGRAIAAELLAGGHEVVLADIDGDAAARTAAELDPDGRRTAAVAADVAQRADVERAFQAAVERTGRVHVLVNNAARTVSRPFFEIEQEEWDDVLAVNLRSVLFGCQIAGAHMREAGGGRIVNMASLAGQRGGLVAGAHYAASKAGILVLTKIVAAELAPHGVTVNAVAPAAIDGPIMASLPPERIAALAASIPVGRVGRPEEVAAIVAHLVGDDAGFITGACFDVNGGVSMR
jgi:3-oxoacyl-[acyl-carrier protein] reductase